MNARDLAGRAARLAADMKRFDMDRSPTFEPVAAPIADRFHADNDAEESAASYVNPLACLACEQVDCACIDCGAPCTDECLDECRVSR